MFIFFDLESHFWKTKIIQKYRKGLMHKRLISILLITEKWQRISQQHIHGMAYYISYSLILIFLTVKNYFKNIKQKQGIRSIINRLKIIYSGRKKELIRKNHHVNIRGYWLLNRDPWTNITIIWELVRNASSQAHSRPTEWDNSSSETQLPVLANPPDN